MAIPFSAVVTPSSISITGNDGKPYTIASTHMKFEAAKLHMRSHIQPLLNRMPLGHEDQASLDDAIDALVELADAGGAVNAAGRGIVTVKDDILYYDDEPIHNSIADHIIWGMKEGFDMEAHIAFLKNLRLNPSKLVVDQLYGFVEKFQMGITPDGFLLVYKKVLANFYDIYSETLDYSPGEIVTMPRRNVNPNPKQTCSRGLHCCAFSYLRMFGSRDGNGESNKIIICKLHPRDIVAIPHDYDHAKIRTCRLESLAEYLGDDRFDILASSPVFERYFDIEFGDDDFDDDDDDDDDTIPEPVLADGVDTDEGDESHGEPVTDMANYTCVAGENDESHGKPVLVKCTNVTISPIISTCFGPDSREITLLDAYGQSCGIVVHANQMVGNCVQATVMEYPSVGRDMFGVVIFSITGKRFDVQIRNCEDIVFMPK